MGSQYGCKTATFECCMHTTYLEVLCYARADFTLEFDFVEVRGRHFEQFIQAAHVLVNR